VLIIKKIKQNEDGSVDAEFALTKSQMSYLVAYAVSELVAKGLVTVMDKLDD
jgi:hypothetical protein